MDTTRDLTVRMIKLDTRETVIGLLESTVAIGNKVIINRNGDMIITSAILEISKVDYADNGSIKILFLTYDGNYFMEVPYDDETNQ